MDAKEHTINVLSEEKLIACNITGADEKLHILPKSNIYSELEHSERPWGCWYSLFKDTEQFQIKKISVKPGAKLSLQAHNHRSEHWIVLSGTAKVTCNKNIFSLFTGESTFIPMGATHRLENIGKINLEMIEVQVGQYVEEDDIIRYDHGCDNAGNKYI